MITKLVIVGAGGHAKVIIDILKGSPTIDIVGCTSSNGWGEVIEGIPVIGDDTILPHLLEKGVHHAFVAIGDNQLRKVIYENLKCLNFQFVNAISPFSYIAPSVKLGTGIAVMPGAVINADSKIKDNVIVNTGATIDHDNLIDCHSHIAPGSNLAGNVVVEEGAFIGTGSKVIPKITIGKWSVVGAGSVVIKEVEPYQKVVGVPAKNINLQ